MSVDMLIVIIVIIVIECTPDTGHFASGGGTRGHAEKSGTRSTTGSAGADTVNGSCGIICHTR